MARAHGRRAFAASNPIEAAIGEALVASGKLSSAGLDRALRLRGPAAWRFLALLLELGLVSERDVAEILAARLGLALAGRNDFPDVPLFEELGANFLRHAKVLPLADEPNAIVLAMADPLDE